MNKNSLTAYDNISATGHLTRCQLAIIGAMRLLKVPVTMHQVADYMGVPLHTISGRFLELFGKRQIKIVDEKLYKKNGRKYYRSLYALTEPELKQCFPEDERVMLDQQSYIILDKYPESFDDLSEPIKKACEDIL